MRRYKEESRTYEIWADTTASVAFFTCFTQSLRLGKSKMYEVCPKIDVSWLLYVAEGFYFHETSSASVYITEYASFYAK